MKKKLTKCMLCGGMGFIFEPNASGLEVRIKTAKLLRKKKYSIREIQRFLGYKSPRAITYLLEK